MSDLTAQSALPTKDPTLVKAETSRKAAKEAASTASLTAMFAIGGLAWFPSWPMAVGVVAVSAMVAVACYFMLREG